LVCASPWVPPPATQALCARAAVAGDHPLLHRIRSGTAQAEEISAWVQSRVCLAEYLARKEILVMSQAVDREARRRWTLRLLAIDGHGDFYGPSKQGLIESWRRLMAQVCGPTTAPSAPLAATLERLFEPQLVRVKTASWIDSLGSTLVDDWVVRNDGTTARMLGSANSGAGSDWALQHNAELAQHTVQALLAQLGPSADDGPATQALASIDHRVALEHAVLHAVQAFAAQRPWRVHRDH
jgi:hypothetical protein